IHWLAVRGDGVSGRREGLARAGSARVERTRVESGPEHPGERGWARHRDGRPAPRSEVGAWPSGRPEDDPPPRHEGRTRERSGVPAGCPARADRSASRLASEADPTRDRPTRRGTVWLVSADTDETRSRAPWRHTSGKSMRWPS